MIVINHRFVTLPSCRKTFNLYVVLRQLLLVLAIHFVLFSTRPDSVSAQPHHGSILSHSESTTPSPIRKHIRHNGGHSESNHLGKHHGHTPPSDPAYPDDPDYDFEAADLLPRPGTYIPSNCSSCIRREELRKRNLEVIKDQILSKLGMRTAPNMTGRYPPRIPPLNHLLDLYGMQGDAPQKGFQTGPVYDEEEDDFHARTEKVISFAQSLPRVQDALDRAPSTIFKGMKSIYFKFSDKVTRSKVDKAHLWIYLRPSSSSSLNKDATAAVHLHTVARVPEDESPVLNKIRTMKVGLEEKGGWVPLEVKKVVSDWFRQPEENLGFVVQANDSSDKSLVVTDPDESDGSLIPFMEVVTTDSRKHRTKRTIGLNCDENSAETRCCRYPLTVDFVEFGWDWIIAPKKYEANYCSGECPYIFLQKYPHTHIVQQANPAGTAGPCCAPRKMSPISMLYFDNEFNIIYGLLPGMVVDRCGCS